jgi:hypothetical protein
VILKANSTLKKMKKKNNTATKKQPTDGGITPEEAS